MSSKRAEDIYNRAGGSLSALEAEELVCVAGHHPSGIVRASAQAKLDAHEEELREQQRAQEAEKEEQARLREVTREYRQLLQDDFLEAHVACRERLGADPDSEPYLSSRLEYVASWIEKETGMRPDREQAAAISAVDGDVQVIARAGSGKTATLVNRAMFLAKHCGVAVDEMLLLAFNRKAAEEMGSRLSELLPGPTPHAMTFHALANRVVHPDERLLYDGPEDEGNGLSDVVQLVIHDWLQDPDFYARVRRVMLAHFREDWEAIIAGRYDKGMEEMLKYRRSLRQESIRGEHLKSRGEKAIADFLYEHGVPYQYEQSHQWGRVYRPDFTIPTGDDAGIIIEYFGREGDSDYDSLSQEKREYWSGRDSWTLLEYSSSDLSSGREAFCEKLSNALVSLGVECRRLSDEELWAKIRVRAQGRFTKTAVDFISRCRKLRITPEALDQLVCQHDAPSLVERYFLEAVTPLYSAYVRRLAEAGEEDFPGVVYRAADLIGEGVTIFDGASGRGDLRRLRYVFIDEFQDFSKMFQSVVDAIRTQNSTVQFFCVGDDWQAINGFAGSDLEYFTRFDHYFRPAGEPLYIATNYRSTPDIVELGNALMREAGGTPARAHNSRQGEALLCDLATFEPSPSEKERHGGDTLTPAVLRLAQHALKRGQHVTVLSRQNNVPGFINHGSVQREGGLRGFQSLLRRHLQEVLRSGITVSTTHKYKGLEQAAVIVVDAFITRYPLIHPDWIFTRILGDQLSTNIAEERRLFYVALTRATTSLMIITESDAESSFLDPLKVTRRLQSVSWQTIPPLASAPGRFTIQVSDLRPKQEPGTFALKDLLKACGYEWHSVNRSRYWWRTCAAEGFDREGLKTEAWAGSVGGVEVRVLDHEDSLIESYLVRRGDWQKTR